MKRSFASSEREDENYQPRWTARPLLEQHVEAQRDSLLSQHHVPSDQAFQRYEAVSTCATSQATRRKQASSD